LIGGTRVASVGAGTWAWGNTQVWSYDTSQDAGLRDTYNALLAGSELPLLFDSADSYGEDGRAETLLGEFGSPAPARGRAFLATKLAPFPSRLTAASFVEAARASAHRLQVARLDVVQAHWCVERYAPWQLAAVEEGLAAVVDAGLAVSVGLSNYGPKGLRRVHAALARRGIPLSLCQAQYSLLSRQAATSGLLETCSELGITPLAYSPLCLGVLSGKYSADGPLPKGARGLLLRGLLRDAAPLLALMREVGAAQGCSPAQVAVLWCKAKGTLPIPGVRSVAQAQDALRCLTLQLSDVEVAALDAAAARCPSSATQNPFQGA